MLNSESGVWECSSAELVQLGQEILVGEQCLRLRATGSSMEPTIRHGDVIWIRSSRIGKPIVGDIVFFKTLDGRALVHRVVRVKPCGQEIHLWTRGDACPKRDKPILAAQTLGVVVAVEQEGQLICLDTPANRWGGLIKSEGKLWRVRIRAKIAGAFRKLLKNFAKNRTKEEDR